MDKSYVYIFLDPRKEGIWYYKDFVFFNQPFYVGEGKNNRIVCHFTPKALSKNSLKSNIINKIYNEGLKPIRKILYENLSKEEALNIESDIINTFGTNYHNNGILSNVFKFGNKFSKEMYYNDYKADNRAATKKAADIKRGKTFEEIYGVEKAKILKEKASKDIKERIKNKKFILPWKGTKLSEERKNNISKRLEGNKRRLGIKHSEKDRQKISDKLSEAVGRPVKVIENDDKINYYSSINKAAISRGVSPQMLNEAFENKNFCNSKKANCRFELISKEEYNLNKI